ncbi:alpha-1,2-fucosyltransferase [Pseudovibrio sp. Tun.PSC04-5.I4]|uniref:alpha-1,2-fucosyltransferase n=1 Tax=Pseudovibrio sp. Tun.PSC04-5.I4 TaxID=1798213 RepID=UPI0008894BF5|nr:alpha-1,2-fucosyltransferase [Pseudovibrio sp. Tun.PSC04-5.I4]SDR47091.1 Glycosyl transferase family 11 [Pseudovibrio sp. Tun.PSC04-5.I4]
MPDIRLPSITIDQMNYTDFVCLRIFAGLGNQMFQYAAGYAQAQRLGKQLLLHIDGGGKQKHASFGLDIFSLETQQWDAPVFQEGSLSKLWRKLSSQRKARTSTWPGTRFSYPDLKYNPAINAIEQGTYIEGYYQSERYFEDCAEDLRKQFSLDHLRKDIAEDLLSDVTNGPTVSVHIRRGDYAKIPKTLEIHGLIGNDFYNSAKSLMEERFGNCRFVIFSDDFEEADKLTSSWDNRILVDTGNRYHDLYLMSQCTHNIIANSSFSWWGAWLNANPEKQVIAPENWFAPEEMKRRYTADICPGEWIRL